MDLADALEPAQELCRVGVDPDHFGGLVGDADLDQFVQLLIDAALEQIDQPLPGDVGTAAAPQLLDLVELVQSVLKLAADLLEAGKLGGFGLLLLGPDDGELLVAQVLQRGEIGLDDLVQIGRAERAIADPREQCVGPGLEQLRAVARELELPLELLMGDARAGQIGVRLGDAPIGQRSRGERHGQKQSRGDEELRLVTHRSLKAPQP